jgi:hypothetical protein
MRVLLSVVTLILLESAFAHSALEPIPSEWLHDGKLVAEDFNFSIDSPSPDSHWLYSRLPDINGRKGIGFIVEASPDTDVEIVVWDNSRGMESLGTKDFVDEIQKSNPKGWRVDEARIEPSAFPLKNSSKFKFTVHLPSEKTLYAYGYVVTGKRTYVLLDYSPEVPEPSQFRRLVGSFALLSPSANTLPVASSNPTSGSLMILAAWGAVIDWRYKRRGGVKPTKKARLYLLVGVLVCGVFIGVLGIRGARAETIGYLTSSLGTLLFALWELSRLLVRRKHPVQPTTLAIP